MDRPIKLVEKLENKAFGAESPRGEDDYEKGSIQLNALIEEYPQLALPHLLLARALIHMNRIDGAIDHLTVASKLDPSSVPTSLLLVNLLQSRGDTDKAMQELDRTSRQPLNVQQRQWVAATLSKLGDPGRAIELLQQPSAVQAAGTQPIDDEQQDFLLARLYAQQRQMDKAEAIVRELLRRPNLAVVQFAVFVDELLVCGVMR